LSPPSLFSVLKNLKGNARGLVMTEPLWGIPFNLYIPYASIYMVALGLSDQQIGLIASISWGFQVVMALVGGIITDKLGRRNATLIFELFSWSVPALISALAQNFWFFLIAGIVNSVWRIVHNSWSCLLVEDTNPDDLVDVYAWIYIAGLVVAFFSPLAALLIKSFSLVPAMRGIYFFAAAMFATKAFAAYALTEETQQGKVRMRETRGQSLFSFVKEYRQVTSDLLKSTPTLLTMGIMLILSASGMVNSNFWGILVTEKLGIQPENLAYFQIVRSIIMILFFFVVLPRLRRLPFKLPMMVGFLGLVISDIILITSPVRGYVPLVISVILSACSYAVVGPRLDQMVVLTVDAKERARIQSLMFVVIILLTSPFGWISGVLSAQNKILPFILNICLFSIGILLSLLLGTRVARPVAAEEAIV
jgi:MFS family permease